MKKAILLSVSLGILGVGGPLVNEQTVKADTSTENVSKNSTAKVDKHADNEVEVVERYYVKSLFGTKGELPSIRAMLQVDTHGNIAVPNHPGYTTPKAIVTPNHNGIATEVIYTALPANVTISYKDEDGNTLHTNNILSSGTFGGSYLISNAYRNVDDYELVNKELLSGTITSEKMNINLVFRRLDHAKPGTESKKGSEENQTEHSTNDKQADVKSNKNDQPSKKEATKAEKQKINVQDKQPENKTDTTPLTPTVGLESSSTSFSTQSPNENSTSDTKVSDVTAIIPTAEINNKPVAPEPNAEPTTTQATRTKQEVLKTVDPTNSVPDVKQSLKLPESHEGVSTNDTHETNVAQPTINVKADNRASNEATNLEDQKKDKPATTEINHEVPSVKESVRPKAAQQDNQKKDDFSITGVKEVLNAQSSQKEVQTNASKKTPKNVEKPELVNPQVSMGENSKQTPTQDMTLPDEAKISSASAETNNKVPSATEASVHGSVEQSTLPDHAQSKQLREGATKVVKVPQVDKKAVTLSAQTDEKLKGMSSNKAANLQSDNESSKLPTASTEHVKTYHLQGVDTHGHSLFSKTLRMTPTEATKFQSENVEFYGYDLTSTKFDDISNTFMLNYKAKKVTFNILNVDENGKILSKDSIQLDFGEQQTYTPKLVPGYQAKQASQTLKADNLLPEEITVAYTKLPEPKSTSTKGTRKKGDKLNSEHHSPADKEAGVHEADKIDSESDEKLPQTGDHNSYLSVLTGLSLLIVLLGKKILKRYI